MLPEHRSLKKTVLVWKLSELNPSDKKLILEIGKSQLRLTA